MAVLPNPEGLSGSGMIPAKSANPIFVALDTTDLDDALQLAERLRGHVGGLKLGLEFFCAHGPETA